MIVPITIPKKNVAALAHLLGTSAIQFSGIVYMCNSEENTLSFTSDVKDNEHLLNDLLSAIDALICNKAYYTVSEPYKAWVQGVINLEKAYVEFFTFSVDYPVETYEVEEIANRNIEESDNHFDKLMLDITQFPVQDKQITLEKKIITL
jgi:hypothetical protein